MVTKTALYLAGGLGHDLVYPGRGALHRAEGEAQKTAELTVHVGLVGKAKSGGGLTEIHRAVLHIQIAQSAQHSHHGRQVLGRVVHVLREKRAEIARRVAGGAVGTASTHVRRMRSTPSEGRRRSNR